MRGFGTKEDVVIRILAHIPAVEIPCLISTYRHVDGLSKGRDLQKDIKSETSGRFEDTLLAILRGPLENDVESVNNGLKGYIASLGTKEVWLDDVLIGRSNADIHAIKTAYYRRFNRKLEDDVRGDLSLKTKRMYDMITAGTRQEDSAPVLPESVKADVDAIYNATEGRHGTEELTVCSILTNRSDAQIRAIAHEYQHKWRRPLHKVIDSEFSDHMKDALLQMLYCGCDRAKRDADRLEACMKRLGTKDERLIAVVTALHWDRKHMAQVRGAYRTFHGQELARRIKGDTSGNYKACLVAMVQ